MAKHTPLPRQWKWISWVAFCLFAAPVLCCQQTDRATAASDRQAMLQQLAIPSLRPPVSQKAANYDESRANLNLALPIRSG